MINIVHASQRHFSDFGWLKTYWLFSFSDYFDPENIQFGALRVFNDDIVAPGTGFPTHPHREMEIITVVLSGAVTHADSMGNKAVIKAGDVQRMSAGTGLTHSEFNLENEPVHFFPSMDIPRRAGSCTFLRPEDLFSGAMEEPVNARCLRTGALRRGFASYQRHDLPCRLRP